jgi:hypothetical protein
MHKLSIGRKARNPCPIKGERKVYNIPVPNIPAIIPSKYGKILFKLPKGEENMKMEQIPPPKLVFEFDITGDSDSWPVNNLSANLIKDKSIKWGSTELEGMRNADVYQTYKDLWLTKYQRANLIDKGIQSTNLAKLRSGAKSASENDSDTELKRVLGNKYEIPLDYAFLLDHHPFYPYIYNEDITFEFNLQDPDLIINSTDPLAKTDYTLSNISFEYSTVYEPNLAKQIIQMSDSPYGITYFYDYITSISFNPIKQSDTSVTLSITDKRRSVRGILLLFKLPSNPEANNDPEIFYTPQITKVEISINGTTHKIFTDDYLEKQMFNEAKKFFLPENRKLDENSNMTMETFYSKHFCLWLDLRSIDDNNLHGTGMKIEDGFNIVLKISKNNTGSGNINVYPYLIADAYFTLMNRRVTNPVY